MSENKEFVVPVQYESMVRTISVPYQAGASWPYLPAQEILLAAMNDMGQSGWTIIEHLWSPRPDATAEQVQLVNIWAQRPVGWGR